MKRLLGLLNLLLCFELIVQPLVPQLSLISSSSSFAQECPSGLQFDAILNRCITSEQTATIMNAVASCASGDKECYRRNAENELKKAEEDNKISEAVANKAGLINKAGKAAMVAVPLMVASGILFRQKGDRKCGSISMYMMAAGGAAVFVGDMLANKQHKKRIKELESEWAGVLKGKSGKGEDKTQDQLLAPSTNLDDQKVRSTEAQSEAFEMLAKKEDSLAKAASTKAGIYAIGAAAFAASAVMAVMEKINLNKLKALIAKAPTPTAKAAATQEYVKAYQKAHCTRAEPDLPKAETTSYSPSAEIRAIALIRGARDIPSVLTYYQDWELSLERRSSPSLDTYEQLRDQYASTGLQGASTVLEMTKIIVSRLVAEMIPLQSAHADDPTPPLEDATAVVEGDEIVVIGKRLPKPQQDFLSKYFYAPIPRSIISGVLAAWLTTMHSHAKKQAKVSKARAKYLREVKDTFADAQGAIGSCTSQDRSNPAKPNCYCYTPEGQRNPGRSNSDICNRLFTGKSLSGPSDYSNVQQANQRVCLNASGNVDENCSCRSNNTCLRAIPNDISGFGLGNLSTLTSAVAPLGAMANGSIAAADIDGSAMLGNAVRLLDDRNRILASDPESANEAKSKSKDIENGLLATGAGINPAGVLGDSSSGLPMNLTPAGAAALLEKELKKEDAPVRTANGGGSIAQPGNNSPGLEFGLTPEQFAAQQSQLASNVMNQQVDYGTNDITNRTDTNLFELLSNRYLRSGMRRLFDESGTAPSDAPAKSDITE